MSLLAREVWTHCKPDREALVKPGFTYYLARMTNLTKNQEAYRALQTKYSKSLIAQFAGVSRQALTKWTEVPAGRVSAIAEATGLRPEEILPEPYTTT